MLCDMRLVGLLFLSLSWLAAQPVVYRVNTLAGEFKIGNDGPAAQAILGRPRHIAYDANGLLYIADTENNMVRRVERDGRITAIAGTGVRGNFGDGGPANAAALNRPWGVAVDAQNLYISDSGNARVRVVNLRTGVMENYAGEGTRGDSGDGGPAGNARLSTPAGLALDNQGNLLIADWFADRVRRVNRSTGIITTIVGTGRYGLTGEDGPATAALLASPEGLAVDTDGSVYIGETDFGRVLKLEPSGTLRRIGGQFLGNNFAEGAALTVWIGSAAALALDRAQRRLYVADEFFSVVRMINLGDGALTNVAGVAFAGGFTPDGQQARGGRMGAPKGVAVSPAGRVAFTDDTNFRVRTVSANGLLETVAGRAPFGGDGGPAVAANLFQPSVAIADGAGGLFIADSGNCVIRRMNAAGLISTFAGQPNVCGASAGTPGEGTPARSTPLNFPAGLARDSQGNLFVSEGRRVRRIAADGATVTTIARDLRAPGGLALDNAQQFLYVAEATGNRITRIDLAGNFAQVYAGSTGGTGGFVDNIGRTEARFELPLDLAVDRQGNLLVTDSGNGRLRRIDASTGNVTTIAGNGLASGAAEGAALQTGIGGLTGLAIDPDGATVYFTSLQRVMQLRNNRITTLAGDVLGGFGGDGGFGPQARFNVPATVRVSGSSLVVADTLNQRIRSLVPLRAAALTVQSGDRQTAAISTALRDPLVVEVRLQDGSAAPGVAVAFTTTGGTLSAAEARTGQDGRASVRLTLPATPSSVTVTATVENLAPVRFTVTANTVVTPMPARPAVSSVISAGSFGAAPRIAPGSWMELYGTNFAANQRQWSGDDFQGTQAPTTLGGVRVLVAGRPAFIQLIAPGQINAQVPDGIGTGMVTVQVITAEGSSEEFRVMAAERAPALLAPPAFNIGGKQYVVALHADGVFAGPENLIAGAAFRPARAGDRVVLYGIGFGAVSPAVAAGQITGGANALPDAQVSIGGQAAAVEYAGLAGGFVGLYQFNVVVPAGVAAGDAALTVSAGGAVSGQALVISVRE
jgi:uncharacterized protein (TIGR03437 family)